MEKTTTKSGNYRHLVSLQEVQGFDKILKALEYQKPLHILHVDCSYSCVFVFLSYPLVPPSLRGYTRREEVFLGIKNENRLKNSTVEEVSFLRTQNQISYGALEHVYLFSCGASLPGASSECSLGSRLHR